MTEKFVTLPRDVVELALNAFVKLQADDDVGLASWDFAEAGNACFALRAALEQPQNHVPEAGNMVPAGWKLVPVEPTRGMIEAGKDAHYEAEKRIQEPDAWEQGGFAKRAVRAAHVFQAMLDAAPQPPTTEQSSAAQQPQGEQEPVAWMVTSEMQDGTRSTYPMIGRFKDVQDCCDFGEPVPLIYQHPQPKREQGPVAWYDGNKFYGSKAAASMNMANMSVLSPVYLHPQPKREPLTHEEIDKLCPQFDDPMRREMWIIGFKAAHNIK